MNGNTDTNTFVKNIYDASIVDVMTILIFIINIIIMSVRKKNFLLSMNISPLCYNIINKGMIK